MNRTSNSERVPLRAKFLRLAPWPASIIAVAVVAACGGGSSGSNFGFLPTSAATPTTSGVVTGSYYRNAKVCIDANNNGRCDSGEASAVTDANGAFKVNGQGALVAEIGTASKRFDPATGVESAVTDALVFRAPAGANGVVSAISTELAALMDANGGDLAAARTALAARIGVSEAQLLADHNKITDVAVRTALQVEIDQSIERIAEAVAEAGAGGNIAQALRNRLRARADRERRRHLRREPRLRQPLRPLPGANGIPGVNPTSTGSVEPQKDFDGSVLPTLPPAWGGVTAAGRPP